MQRGRHRLNSKWPTWRFCFPESFFHHDIKLDGAGECLQPLTLFSLDIRARTCSQHLLDIDAVDRWLSNVMTSSTRNLLIWYHHILQHSLHVCTCWLSCKFTHHVWFLKTRTLSVFPRGTKVRCIVTIQKINGSVFTPHVVSGPVWQQPHKHRLLALNTRYYVEWGL